MIFGGNNGFNYFDPDKIKKNPEIPDVIFTDFKLFNKSVSINDVDSPLAKHISQTKKITLNHKQSVLTFEYSTNTYSLPEKNQFATLVQIRFDALPIFPHKCILPLIPCEPDYFFEIIQKPGRATHGFNIPVLK